MSRRIFTERVSQTQPENIPMCYYHKNNFIKYFCIKKSCTLPLCEQCLILHKRQHINQKQIAMDGILQFNQSKSQAILTLEERSQEIKVIQSKFKNKITQYHQQIISILNQQLQKFLQECLIADGSLEILDQIHKRNIEIEKGSLKQLIKYYQDIYGAEHFRKLYKLYSGDYLQLFNFNPKIEQLKKAVRQGIINKNIVENEQKYTKNQYGKENQSENYQSEKVKQNEINKQEEIKIERDARLGESSIYQYDIKSQKSKQKKQNIYTQNNSKIGIKTSRSSNHSNSQGKKKKGLSLVKSHSILPSVHQLPSKIQTKAKESIETKNQLNSPSPLLKQKQGWKRYVNMGKANINQQFQNRQTKKQQKQQNWQRQVDLLNPKEMRQLMLRKKQKQITERQKILSPNAHNFLLIPTSQKL